MHAVLFLLAAGELFPQTTLVSQYLDELDLAVRRWQAMEVSRRPVLRSLSFYIAQRSAADVRLCGLQPQARLATRGFPSPSSAARSGGIAGLAALLERRALAARDAAAQPEESTNRGGGGGGGARTRLLGTVDAKLRAHHTAAGMSSARPAVAAVYARGTREVLAALSALPGWRELPSAVEPATLRLATDTADSTGMLRDKALAAVLDEVATILQLPPPAASSLQPEPAELQPPPAVDAFADHFSDYDVNGDGYISASELQQLGATVAQADLTVHAADLDGDGRISYEEWTQAVELRAEGRMLLPKDLHQLTVDLGWRHSQKRLDLDASVLLIK